MLLRFASHSAANRRSVPSTAAAARRCWLSTQPLEEGEASSIIHERESFLTGTSSIYAEQMYELYEQDPNSVHASWKQYFDNLQQGVPYDESEYNKPTAAATSVQRFQSGVRALYNSV